MTEQTTRPADVVDVRGFPVALDRAYEPDQHMWVAVVGPGRVRVGLDALGVETSGTLAQLSLGAVGTPVSHGAPLGQLEAAKFVGPLVSPVAGTVAAVNEAVLADPGLVERAPYDAGWLAEIAVDDVEAVTSGLLSGADAVREWFAAKVDDYRLKGVIAQ